MRVNELMVGDLVMASLHANEYQVCKVVCLEGYREAVAVYDIKDEDEKIIGRWTKDIKPIPLTKDMAEVNGFFLHNGTYYRSLGFLGDEFSRSGIEIDFYNFAIVRIECYRHGHVDRVQLVASYVHEFQHALRLAGVNDFADIFKIEQ